jgi:hypothetical protein
MPGLNALKLPGKDGFCVKIGRLCPLIGGKVGVNHPDKGKISQ